MVPDVAGIVRAVLCGRLAAVSNPKHWFSYDIFPSFGGRCQKAVLGVCLSVRQHWGPGRLNVRAIETICIIMTADIRYIIYAVGTSVIQPTGEVSVSP